MQVGYSRVSKSDGSQSLDLQNDELIKANVKPENIYSDLASGKKEDRPQLQACLKSLREGDILVVWKLDRLGRNLHHLVSIIKELNDRKVGFKVLTGHGANIDTTTANGRLVFGIFAALAEFERDLISERTKAGLKSARARGRKGGRKSKMTKAKLELVIPAIQNKATNIAALCRELGITRQTLYRHVDPDGSLRHAGMKILN